MGNLQSVEALQWLAFIGQTRNDIIHAGNGREVHPRGVPKIKVDGYTPKTKEVFEYLGSFWHARRHKPIGNTEETLLNRYEETKTRLEKIKNAVLQLFRYGGGNLYNCCEKILALKINLVCTLT